MEIKKYIKTLAMDLIVVIVSLAYVFYQMVTLERTDVSLLVLLAQAVIGIICGIMIKAALGENGFSKGYNSQIWEEEESKYNNACLIANDYAERVDNFYQYREIEKKELYRRKNLQAARLKYAMWFDENGDYIGSKKQIEDMKLGFHQKYVLWKCITVRIYPLNLFSEYANTSEQDTKREITDRTQRTKNIAKNTISATLIAIIGTYFIPLFNWNWANLISSTMQVALWVLFGILQLYTNYNFVVRDKVAVLRKKKEEICLFTKNCEKGMYTHSPYKVELNEKEIKDIPVQNESQTTNEKK